MMDRRRGVLAALFIAGAAFAAPSGWAPAIAAAELAPGETVLTDGLTMEVRHATGSGAVALEIWVRCPANGWSATEPGVARLTALAVVDSRSGSTTLRDAVRARGGEVGVSIFQTATEFVVLAPADRAPELEDALMHAVFRPSIDAAALDQARARLAAEQAPAEQSTDAVLRDKAFATIFPSGPLHDSTLGDPKFLQSATLTEVRLYASRSYAPGASAIIALGNGDAGALRAHIVAAAPPSGPGSAMPASTVGAAPAQPVGLTNPDVDSPGVALAWSGPPISDRRAATAMDFLSDYLADPRTGAFASAATAATAGASIEGQFVTLEQNGLFYVTAFGDGVDPAAMQRSLRTAVDQVLGRPVPNFAQALSAYETRLLRQMDSPQGLADNYGWYFAMDAPSYAPSATDVSLSGEYFAAAASLTPDFVRDVARRYLGAAPAVITLTPAKASTASASGGELIVRSMLASCAAACVVGAILAPSVAQSASAPRPPLTPDSFSTGATPFLDVETTTLPNRVIVAGQTSTDTPLVSVNVFLPAGAAQQPVDRGGVAGVTAAVILETRVDRDRTLAQVASDAGASLSYTIDPQDTRFSIECKAADLPGVISSLATALKSPDTSALEDARASAMRSAQDAIADPAMTAYSMIRQSEFAGTGYARLDQGDPTALARLSASDVSTFAAQLRHGPGTVVALTGDVTQTVFDAAKSAFDDFAATPAPRGAAPPKARANELVAHRSVAAPWIAVGYSVPSQFSPDFPAMLVIEALLGRGGDVHSFSYGSDAQLPADFVGGYYQYEADPGMLVEFYNGADIFDELRTLDTGVTRLRSSTLPPALVDEARTAAEGTFLTSVATLDDQSWLLGRSMLSPSGWGFEDELPAKIAAVTSADVKRVAQKYLGTQILALVSPNQVGP